ncbi:MAG: alpha/beta fold hydrolase [Opitutaceae bacterium]|nr:alpha/beta fold hydrolase [Opitutaceae bacterium]
MPSSTSIKKLFKLFLFAWLVSGAAVSREYELKRFAPPRADKPIPTEDFFRQSVLRSPEINSGGTHISFIASGDDDRSRLLIYEIATEKIEVVGGEGGKDVYWSTWLEGRKILFRVSFKKRYGIGVMVGEAGRLVDAHPVLWNCDAIYLGTPDSSRHRPVFWLRRILSASGAYEDAGVVAIRTELGQKMGRVTVHAGGASSSEPSNVLEDNWHIEPLHPSPQGGIPVAFLLDAEGRLAFGFTAAKGGVVTLHRWVDASWRATPLHLEEFQVLSHADTPGELIVLGPRTDGKPRSVEAINPLTMESKGPILSDEAYDFNGRFFRDPKTLRIVGAHYERDLPAVQWFDQDYEQMQKALDGIFNGLVVRIMGADKERKTLLVRTFSDVQPDTYYFVDQGLNTIGLLGSSRPWIDPSRMRPMRVLKFKTRDGKTLDAYLTLPAGATPTTPAPLVVLAHGGPFARDEWGFNPEVQFLASRGFAVLQPNYRGSTGYSWQFTLAEEWDFVKMHDDVTDAVRTAFGTGLVDAERVAIMGSSFGGYLALSGVTREPGLYRCAITNAGVFDWAQLVRSAKFDQYSDPRYAEMTRHLGEPERAAEKFSAISPIHKVSRIKVPVLVAHGKEDHTVEIAQSKRLLAQLEKHHVEHEQLLIPGEGHNLVELPNRVRFYERVEKFLSKHLLTATASRTDPN